MPMVEVGKLPILSKLGTFKRYINISEFNDVTTRWRPSFGIVRNDSRMLV